ncbi:MAG: class I adenylate-forming enzyme family protein [Lachnospiraceae bacterium]|nr:class I adenylate-forming enzyme family protein [Lachnospiraceae bacterium]
MISGEKLRNIKDMFDAIFRESPKERVMVKYMEGKTVKEITAHVLSKAIDSYSAWLTRQQLTEGHIGIIGPNCYEWLVSFSAVLRLGAVAVLMAETESPKEILEDVAQTDIRAVLYAPSVKARLAETGLMEKIPCVPFYFQEAEYEREGKQKTGQKIEAGQKVRLLIAENHRGPEDPACIIFTSGTSGTKKAVVHANRALIAGQCNDIIGHPFTSQLAVLPFHHLAGFNAVFNTWCLGGTICLAEDMRYLFAYLEAMKPDYLFAVPAIANVLVRRLKKADDYGASLGWNLRLLNCGGAKFQPEIVETLVSHKIGIMNCYGASEAGGIGFAWDMALDCVNTIGKPPAGLEAKIVDGELVIRSDSVMLGYYKEPEMTNEVLKDGWYYTGDLCYQDENGCIYLTGRKNNLLILSNGENVSPEELEAKLNELELVSESMVVAENDLLAAVIVVDELQETVQTEIRKQIDQLNRSLPNWKKLEKVYFREEAFEKNAMGKIIRIRGNV